MITWYQIFIVALILLRIGASSRDRNALSIVLVASFASTLLVHLVTHQIQAAWKLVIPGAVEVLTILAMLQWSRNRTGYIQVCLLTIAWLSHVICYADIAMQTDVVYSRYRTILMCVAVGQLAACYDTMHFNFCRACDSANALWADCFLDIHNPSHGSAVSVVSIDKKVQAFEGNREANQNETIA